MRLPILSALLLVAGAAYAVDPVTITFDERALDVHGVNTFRSQRIDFRGVTFSNGYLIDLPENPSDPLGPRTSRKYATDPAGCFGCGTISITFPNQVEQIKLTVVGFGRGGLEVWDGPPARSSLSTSKIVGRAGKGEETTITVDKVRVGPALFLYSYTDFGFLGRADAAVRLEQLTFTPPAPPGDEVPPQPVFSPRGPTEAGDTRIVVERGTGLDTQCSFRGSGLEILLPVKRVVGRVDGSGKLLNAQQLTRNGYLSRTATITLEAYDVDGPKEVDAVYFNSHPVGNLAGINNGWQKNTFIFPVEWVNFGEAFGDINVQGLNTIRIDIDEMNHPVEKWCTSIDWVSLEFGAIAPIFLVHGINAGPKTWEDDFTGHLTSIGIPYRNDIQLVPNGSVAENGGRLGARIRKLSQAFGARACHLIAHSKGGADSLEFLSQHYVEHYMESGVRVLSLHTLSTPFAGSVIADIITTARAQATGRTSNNPYIREVISRDYSFLKTPCCSGLIDLTTRRMRAIIRDDPFPRQIVLYNYAADADTDDDRAISFEERTPAFRDVFLFNDLIDRAAEATYLALGTIQRVKIAERAIKDSSGSTVATLPLIEVAEYNSTFLENDLFVTTNSAQHESGLYVGQIDANHSTVKSRAVAAGILSRIRADFPIQEVIP